MSAFSEFLAQRLSSGGFTTEDALASFLPLARQVAAAHQADLVAPLDGVAALRVDRFRLWFEEAQLQRPALQTAQIEALQHTGAGAMEVVGQYRVDLDIEAGADTGVSLQLGRRGEPLTQPVYLPGFLSWEQELGHHDPLSDIFVLGLILASLTCGLDFDEPDQLASFVQHRRNLFVLNPRLHPVLAKAILRMTELNRHRRPQELSSLLYALENYRDQDVDFELDLARVPDWASADRGGRRQRILSCLQKRLFEISRRNRLLHFRATMQTLNLTWASVPLSFDVASIRPEQIVTWGHDFKQALGTGKPIALNEYLHFEEALYLPGQLDAIRTEARRDLTEFGFAQLRLVLCFLRWANLKEKPVERFDSPLVLLPVRLTKTKGVRDVYLLEPLGTEAEINPILRHYLKQLYAVELPEHIDLAGQSLDDLHALLARKVQSSEPAVSIDRIDRPRVNVIHARAQRRLDQYRRRTRLSGRGVRSLFDIDYSYARDNYHPLGLRLFQTRLSPAEPHLRALVAEMPRPRSFMAAGAAGPTVKERTLLGQVEEETNPYRWEFDLCNIVLGNFHYRKMSLVRDYDLLQARSADHAGFDAIFSLAPRPAPETPGSLPLQEDYTILSCDPTQTSALALARTGRSFIIQGPPGTGKSQTITNLIADYVARGQRVLFVCEKRAALDVVYHRLQQVRLAPLCCLIHDAQDDKKEFIQDLKQTYEAFVETKQGRGAEAETQRCEVVAAVQHELAPLERFHRAMDETPPDAGLPLRRVLQRAIELAADHVELPPRRRELLPAYDLCVAHQGALQRLGAGLRSLQGTTILAQHPLRRLHPRHASIERPLEQIHAAIERSEKLLRDVRAALQQIDVPAESWPTLEEARALLDMAVALEFLAERDLLAVLDPRSKSGKKLAELRKRYAAKQDELRRARLKTKLWRHKLSPEDTWNALQQAQQLEKSTLRYLRPSWWRLRSVLRRCYDFSAHRVSPSWTHVLGTLLPEQRIEAELDEMEATARLDYGFEGSLADYERRIAALIDSEPMLAPALREARRRLVASEQVRRLVAVSQPLAELSRELSQLLTDSHELTFAQLQDELNLIEESLDDFPAFVPCLRELATLPAGFLRSWCDLGLPLEQLEASSARRTGEELLRADAAVAHFSGSTQAHHLQQLGRLEDRRQACNAELVRAGICERFLERAALAAVPGAQLGADQKELKARYSRGRRELEHEFSKTMRFRAIRDLVAGDSGLVLRDLKPIWLMSPFSVSDTLPLEEDLFDVVIFDEASQIPLEDAVPAVFRAPQVLVVGDQMQLPPTRFFSASAGEEDAVIVQDEAGQEMEYDLSSSSFLDHAARNLSSTLLGWHYRSRSETLISFCNAAFYQGRLLTAPDVRLPPRARGPIEVRAAAEAAANVDELLARPLSFHFVKDAVYEGRRNAAEAEYLAQLVRALLARGTGLSLGIIAFSEAQQGEIERALARLAETDATFATRLEAEWVREEEGQFVGLLVKNLENIQGDERDIILLSICYGPARDGRMLMNFGPINQMGGERRLNVAFSRARQHMVVVSSIRGSAITNDYNDGARALKNYLGYSEALSSGNVQEARRVLDELSLARASSTSAATSSVITSTLAARLRGLGYQVDSDVGHSRFRCDLAIRGSDESSYRLAILLDSATSDGVLERAVLRPRLLQHFGWKVHMVLTKDWFENEEAVVQTIVALLEGPSPGAAPGEEPGSWKKYLEASAPAKFWEVEVAGRQYTIRFGRIGSAGQTRTKRFPDAKSADRAARRLVEEKQAHGYEERG